MAKVIEHGKYWHLDTTKVYKMYKNVRVKCPECGNTIPISSYYLETYQAPEAWCICGCKFIPEASDSVVED